MRRTLHNKVVVITGASSGIGRAAAIAFAREGARVVVAARRADRLQAVQQEIESNGGACLPVPTDVTNPALLQRLMDATLEHYGRVDVWVNNAGAGFIGSVEQTTDEDMDRLWRVNYQSVFQACRIALQQMRRQESGHIINVASMAARYAVPLNAGYCAAKAAMVALTEALDLELEGSGIRASLVMPAVTDTEFSEAAVRKIGDPPASRFGGSATAEQVAARIVQCALRRQSHVYIVPGSRLTLAITDLFPGIWRAIARKYIAVRTGGAGIPTPEG